MATQQTFEFLGTKAPLIRRAKAPHVPQSLRSRAPEDTAKVAADVTPVPLEASRGPVSLQELRSLAGCVTTFENPADVDSFSTGSSAIDHLLPHRGLRVNAITEWIGAAAGSGAAALSMVAVASQLKRCRGPLVVVGGIETFYPPAAVSLGVPPQRVIWVRSKRHADVVWAMDQALRSRQVAAVWGHVSARLDDRDARRLQLAAEAGKTPGLLVRPVSVRGRPSFADIRFHVKALLGSRRCLQVTVDRCRGGTAGQQLDIEIDDRARIKQTNHESATMHLASQLACPASTKPKSRRRA